MREQRSSAGGPETLDREMRRTGSLTTLVNRAVAERVGMHPTDWDCLDLLDWAGPLTPGAIARSLGLTSGAVTGLVDRLEAAGRVRRESDPQDRRKVVVVPLLGADEAIAAAFEPLASGLSAVYARMSERDRRTVLRFLRRVNEVLVGSMDEIRAASVVRGGASSR